MAILLLMNVFARQQQRIQGGVKRHAFEFAHLFQAGVVLAVVHVRIVGAFTELIQRAVAGQQPDHIVCGRDAFEVGRYDLRAERETFQQHAPPIVHLPHLTVFVTVHEESAIARQRQPRYLAECFWEHPSGERRVAVGRRIRVAQRSLQARLTRDRGRVPENGRHCVIGGGATRRSRQQAQRDPRASPGARHAGFSCSLRSARSSPDSLATASPISTSASPTRPAHAVRMAVSIASRLIDFRVRTR